MKKLFILLCTALSCLECFGQLSSDTIKMIDNVFLRYQPTKPGCQLSISRNGVVIFTKAWGMANLERRLPVDTKSVFISASVAKQFTAAAILLLEQQNKLSLTNDIRSYIPSLPNYGTPISLNMLMHHTSGLRDWGEICDISGWQLPPKEYTNKYATELILRQKKLNNVPGEVFTYSNSNYILLANVVETISGMTLNEFCKKHIFNPAKMGSTSWDHTIDNESNVAVPYKKKNIDFYEIDLPKSATYGPGGLYTTTEDLLKWNEFYFSGTFGKPSLLSKQLKVDTLRNGTTNPYGAGLYIGKEGKWTSVSHGGSSAGYRSHIETIPELKLSIAWLSNSSEFDTAQVNVIEEIKKIFIAKTENERPIERSEIKISERQLKNYTGLFKSAQSDVDVQIAYEDNYLKAFGTKLIPVAKHMFNFGNVLFSFKNASHLTISPPVTDPMRYYKVDTLKLSPARIHEYQGKFYSVEAGASFDVIATGTNLKFTQTHKVEYKLDPIEKDVFFLKDLNADIHFHRDKNERIKGMSLSTGRATQIYFIKSSN
ncbi:MAG: serine hydrolase domain-containing protein [Bacteroidota bacterium]